MIYILVLPLKGIYCSSSAINQKPNFPAASQTETLLYSMREEQHMRVSTQASLDNISELGEERQISCQYAGK